MKAATFSMRVSLTMGILLSLALALPQAPAHSSSMTAGANQVPNSVPGDSAGSGLGQPTTPLQSVLNPDGTINMKSGFSGSLDASGWQMVSAPGMPPRFVPSDKGAGAGTGAGASSPDGPSEPSAPAVPGDENWDGRFVLPIINNRVYAVAVNSTTGDAFLGGAFVTPCCTSPPIYYITEWNRNNGFNQLNLGTTNEVDAIAVNSTTGDMYAGGVFTQAGAISAHHIARWDGSAWHALGSGMNDYADTIAVSSTGDVYAGGNFTTAGGVSANHIARWNGSSWSALGSGMNDVVRAIAVNNFTGDVYAGGYFTTAGGVSAHYIARWDGSTWHAVGSGTNNNVTAIAVRGITGDVYAGGYFTTAGGVSANYIARWNGSSWSTLGSGSSNGTNTAVYAITLNDTTGNVYVGGEFTTAGGVSANRIAKWDGSSWSTLGGGGGMNNDVYGVAVDSTEDVYAGGNFTSAGVTSAHYIAEWGGTRWSTLGSGINGTCGVGENGIALNGTGDVYVGGCFSKAGGVTANNIAKWDGSSWTSLGSGTNGSGLFATAVDSATGDVYAGGIFTMTGGVTANNIAKWNGSAWSALGSGMNDKVSIIAINGATGDVYAGGRFTTAGGVSAHGIARWNGSAWSALGSGMSGGTPYTEVDAIGINGATGDVYAGGYFTTAGGVSAHGIARWNGSAWSALGSGMSGGSPYTAVYAIALNSTTGDLYAGGDFTTAGGVSAHYIARWNGSAWSALGSGTSGGTDPGVLSIAVSSTGDVYAGGLFTTAGGVGAHNIAKWNGSAWSALGSGTSYGSGDGVFGIALNSSTGDLYVGGDFTELGGKLSNNFGIWHNPGLLACTITFSDVPVGSTFYPYIHCLACLGIVSGYPDGTYRPGNPETRAQLAKIVSNSAGFNDNQTTQMFQDVPVSAPFFQYIGRLASRGYIGGYPCGGLNEPCVPPANLPYFRPNTNTSRGQISKIDANAAGFNDNPSGQQFQDVPIGSTYYTYTYRLATRNVMSGHPCGGPNQPCVPPGNLPYFVPNANATRGQASKIVGNTFFPDCQTP